MFFALDAALHFHIKEMEERGEVSLEDTKKEEWMTEEDEQ